MSKKKFIRRQSFISKIQSFPFDLYLYVNEVITSIDWNSVESIHIANTLGISLTLLDLAIVSLLNYYNSINSKSNNLLFKSNYYDYQYLKKHLSTSPKFTHYDVTASFTWVLSLLSNAITVASIANFILLIKSSRKYGLLYLTENNKSTTVYKTSTTDWLGFLDSLFVKLFGKEEDVTQSSIDQTHDTTVVEEDTYYMNTWDPNKFTLHLFITLNPLNIFIIHISSLLISLAVMVIQVTMSWLIISKFNQLIIDKQIIYQEMFKEYNNKFVNPKLNILKKDVAIDATKGPYDTTVLTDKQPYLLSKTKKFVTHDARGKEVVEYGNVDVPKFTIIDQSTLASFTTHDHDDLNFEERGEEPWYTSSTPYQPNSQKISQSTPNRLISPQRLNMSNRPVLGYNSESSRRNSFTSPSPVRMGVRSGTISPRRSPFRSPSPQRYDRYDPAYDRYYYDNL
ncbi:uncharacterized protein SPAPADRAFT_58753 [Spathaspora passalidarum NRRL Y-27907]|uniref:Nuclear rim protein 1 n=1 Tax=Spathaspora passalidarum (strain NRRL Y-27907 / 11-Y1) TaxID=619300 RepID=G3AH91_SPAPN|nr:uncharacterized protein SPAPADRAFT_58753 [Spathaspora passalidarum NRRL Y-27907]EGW35521.1 hypothetical protein SPAPADRAFT_58753 [Spathaspora passalidarum NRRL Y-27907]